MYSWRSQEKSKNMEETWVRFIEHRTFNPWVAGLSQLKMSLTAVDHSE